MLVGPTRCRNVLCDIDNLLREVAFNKMSVGRESIPNNIDANTWSAGECRWRIHNTSRLAGGHTAPINLAATHSPATSQAVHPRPVRAEHEAIE